jgi:hypothetical protein
MSWVSTEQLDRREGTVAATRLTAAAVLLGCLGLLAVAAWLEPAQAGLSTHTQLGLSGCAWQADHGGPCPSCGMTTAFALAAEGRLAASFVAQPAAALLAVLTAAAVWGSAWVLWSGSAAGLRMVGRIWALPRGTLPVAVVILIGLAWAYKLAVM